MKPPEQWLPSASDMEDEETGRRQAEADGAHLDRLVEEECAACAELVRAAGCICKSLYEGWLSMHHLGWDGEYSGYPTEPVTRHDSRCPEALAAAILARGKT